MLKNFTDKALLLSENEELAFRIIYDRYWDRLYKKARQRLGNKEDAQDIVQEIFVSLWRNRQRIEINETLSQYLFAALRFAIIKLVYRKAKKGVLYPLSVEDLEIIKENQPDIIELKELQGIVNNELKELPPRMQQIYRMSRNEHLKASEIASRLNLSEQTVKNTLTSALKRLREKISGYTSFLLFFFF